MQKGFTLAEGATHVDTVENQRICGFTLAEVLITLSVIGVVAALTIPQLAKNMNDYAFTKSKEITLAKITEATNQMKSNDVLSGYTTNEAFADEFAKYMKFGKRCTSANLDACFSPTFKLADNTEIDTSTLTTGDKLGHSTYTANTVGIGLVNGTSMILAFDPACARIDPFNNTTDTTSCMALVYDINGAGKPNQVGKDIGFHNVTITGASASSCTTIPGGLCVSTSDVTYVPTSEAPFSSNDNYWAGARDACIAQGMRMPSYFEINTIYAQKASLTGLSGIYWSTDEYGPSPCVDAGITDFDTGTGSSDVKLNNHKIRCVK